MGDVRFNNMSCESDYRYIYAVEYEWAESYLSQINREKQDGASDDRIKLLEDYAEKHSYRAKECRKRGNFDDLIEIIQEIGRFRSSFLTLRNYIYEQDTLLKMQNDANNCGYLFATTNKFSNKIRRDLKSRQKVMADEYEELSRQCGIDVELPGDIVD